MLFHVCVRIYTGKHPRNKLAGLKDLCICNFDGSWDLALHSSYANLHFHQQRMRWLLPHSLTTTISISQVLLPSRQFTWIAALTCPEELRWLAWGWSVAQMRAGMRTWYSTSQFPEHFPPIADDPLGASSQCDFTPSSQHPGVFVRRKLEMPVNFDPSP